MQNNYKNNLLFSNLINIRWIAITGQLFAILFVYFILSIQIPILLCCSVVIISIIINIFNLVSKKENNYLTNNEAFYFLLYDTSQLAVLLYLTGGIFNPFCLLLIAPVIISASFLPRNFSIFLAIFSILIIIFISFFHLDLKWPENFIVPDLFVYGLISSLFISIIFIAIYVYILANTSRQISTALNQTQIALINQKKLSEVGSLTAAAVHELSTPLNTIFLIISDLKKDNLLNQNNEIKSELTLLESQANRCKDILFSISKNPQNLKDNFLDKISLSNLINMSFEKFKKKDISLLIKIQNEKNEPLIKISDEIIYGLGNIIQNATEHAESLINVEIFWDQKFIFCKIIDDGKGFSREILDKIGDPFISKNKSQTGMGLGIFIAKNLIENSGGSISFNNNTNNNGSLVEIHLRRDI